MLHCDIWWFENIKNIISFLGCMLNLALRCHQNGSCFQMFYVLSFEIACLLNPICVNYKNVSFWVVLNRRNFNNCFNYYIVRFDEQISIYKYSYIIYIIWANINIHIIIGEIIRKRHVHAEDHTSPKQYGTKPKWVAKILVTSFHDDVIKWKHFPRNWPFVRGIHRSPVNSPHKGQWRGALTFSLICVWINGWINNRETGDFRRYRAHYDVTVMGFVPDY